MSIKSIARRIRRPIVKTHASIARSLGVDSDYSGRVAAEKSHFNEDNTADELPQIFHYWSNKYLRPKLEALGFTDPEAMFAALLERAYRASAATERRFLSIGTGRCDTELRLARYLVDRGCTDFVIECMELNPDLLAQAMAAARHTGLDDRIVGVARDANKWTPDRTYDGVLANSSLHHVLNLEGVFQGIEDSLAPTGIFVTSDMIGRNGHMRWPEALEIVHEYWRELPSAKTYNHPLKRFEKEYDNWDCSFESFEGIRAQDILPLLVKHFDFDVFVPYANVIDPFIDRAFGPNFAVESAWDTDFIDRVHRRDEAEIGAGAIKPTHIVAAMCVGRPGQNRNADGLTPQFCVRSPRRAPRRWASPPPPTDRGVAMSNASSASGGNDAVTGLEFSVVPAVPRPFELVVARLRLSGECAKLGVGTMKIEHGRIRILLAELLPVPNAPSRSIDVQLGRFPAGQIEVAVHAAPLSAPTILRIDVADFVQQGVEVRPTVDYSDLWWNADESGWGIAVAQHASDRLVATWFAYEEGGDPIWYSLQPGGWSNARTFSGPIFRYRGPDATKAGAPFSAQAIQIGRGTLAFDDYRTGVFTSEIDSLPPVTKPIRRMDY
jgi:SAM-dependent methyltransferase